MPILLWLVGFCCGSWDSRPAVVASRNSPFRSSFCSRCSGITDAGMGHRFVPTWSGALHDRSVEAFLLGGN